MAADTAFDAARTARSLVRRARRGALATRDAESGFPYASLVAVATAADGAPLLLLSDLARHTRNLVADLKVSLLVEDVGMKDPLAGARVTLLGEIAASEDEDEKRRYLARLPSAEGFAGFKDFRFYRVEPQGAHLVAGFGRIETLPREAVMTDVSDAGELLAGEAAAAAHMNEDHPDALALYATRLLGAKEAAWRCDGFDPEGLELSAGGRALYLPFRERVHAPGALRQALVALAAEARAIAA